MVLESISSLPQGQKYIQDYLDKIIVPQIESVKPLKHDSVSVLLHKQAESNASSYDSFLDFTCMGEGTMSGMLPVICKTLLTMMLPPQKRSSPSSIDAILPRLDFFQVVVHLGLSAASANFLLVFVHTTG